MSTVQLNTVFMPHVKTKEHGLKVRWSDSHLCWAERRSVCTGCRWHWICPRSALAAHCGVPPQPPSSCRNTQRHAGITIKYAATYQTLYFSGVLGYSEKRKNANVVPKILIFLLTLTWVEFLKGKGGLRCWSSRTWAKQKNLFLIHFAQRFFRICGVFFSCNTNLVFSFLIAEISRQTFSNVLLISVRIAQTDHESSGSFTKQITRVIWIASTWA